MRNPNGQISKEEARDKPRSGPMCRSVDKHTGGDSGKGRAVGHRYAALFPSGLAKPSCAGDLEMPGARGAILVKKV